MKNRIFLIIIGLSSLLLADFSRNNNVVTDNIMKLEWQDDYGDNEGVIKQSTWQEAISYCENLLLNNNSDWRLPNINELNSLVDDTRYNPSISNIFQYTISKGYWSSTTFHTFDGYAWVVYFDNGSQFYYGDKGGSHYVRCVRGGQ